MDKVTLPAFPTKLSEVVEAMIKGLTTGHTVVLMSTYGKKEKGICYGCAATNALCEFGLPVDSLMQQGIVGDYKPELKQWLSLEGLVEQIRTATPTSPSPIKQNTFLSYVEDCGLDYPSESYGKALPFLATSSYLGDLPAYQEYAEWLKSHNC